jgi:L-lactate dehydrogenase complex protein LldG
MQGSRQAILARRRRAAGPSAGDRQTTVTARLSNPGPTLVPQRAEDGPQAYDAFCQRVEASAATLQTVAGWDAVALAVTDYLKQRNLPTALAVAPDPRLDPLADHGLLTVHRGAALPQDLVGVSTAVLGVAETGTLVLTSGADTPTSLNFLPDVHVICLARQDVVGGYESIWTHLRQRQEQGHDLPRTVNMITGPSRTGDIEQTIQLGAHGPRQVHVILVDE